MQAAVGAKAVDKQPQQKKESDHIMAGILEEVRLSTLKLHVPMCQFVEKDNFFEI